MQCCRTMPCTPANKSHNCCKTMVFAHTPNILPVGRVSLTAPTVAAIDYSQAIKTAQFIPVARVAVETQQHSPPQPYKLSLPLLI